MIASTESGTEEVVPLPATDDEWRQAEHQPLPAGTYRLTIRGDPTRVEPVVDVFAVA